MFRIDEGDWITTRFIPALSGWKLVYAGEDGSMEVTSMPGWLIQECEVLIGTTDRRTTDRRVVAADFDAGDGILQPVGQVSNFVGVYALNDLPTEEQWQALKNLIPHAFET